MKANLCEPTEYLLKIQAAIVRRLYMESFDKDTIKKYKKDGQYCPFCQSKNFAETDKMKQSSQIVIFFKCNDCNKYWLEHREDRLRGLFSVDMEKYKGALDPFNEIWKVSLTPTQVIKHLRG
jgi:hypothetical protein